VFPPSLDNHRDGLEGYLPFVSGFAPVFLRLRLGFERSDLIRIDTNHEVVDVIVGFVANGAPITAARPNKLDEGKDGPIDLPSS
jgi:hypothetical protein